jgi:hypothetical protein
MKVDVAYCRLTVEGIHAINSFAKFSTALLVHSISLQLARIKNESRTEQPSAKPYACSFMPYLYAECEAA